MIRDLLMLGVTTILLVACGRVPDLDSKVYSTIHDEAQKLMLTSEIGEIDDDHWPVGISGLNPEALLVRPEGLYIVTGRLFVEEWGYFIKRAESEFSPPAHGDPSYTKVTDSLYKYKVKG